MVGVQLHWYYYKSLIVFYSWPWMLVFFFQEAPTNKLLYAKDIPTYKEEVKSYYKAIRDLPPLSSLEMEEFLTQESKVLLESRNKIILVTSFLKSHFRISQQDFLSLRNMKMNLMKKWP